MPKISINKKKKDQEDLENSQKKDNKGNHFCNYIKIYIYEILLYYCIII